MNPNYSEVTKQVSIGLWHLYNAVEDLNEADPFAIMINAIARDLLTVEDSLEIVCENTN